MDIQEYIRILGSFVFLFGILFLILKLNTFYHQKKYNGSMKVIDRIGLATGVALFVVEVDGKKLLIGMGGKDVSLLKELS